MEVTVHDQDRVQGAVAGVSCRTKQEAKASAAEAWLVQHNAAGSFPSQDLSPYVTVHCRPKVPAVEVLDLTAGSSSDDECSKAGAAASRHRLSTRRHAGLGAAQQPPTVELRLLKDKVTRSVCSLRVSARGTNSPAGRTATNSPVMAVLRARPQLVIHATRLITAKQLGQFSHTLPGCFCEPAERQDASKFSKFADWFLAGRVAVISLDWLDSLGLRSGAGVIAWVGGHLYVSANGTGTGAAQGCNVFYAATGAPHRLLASDAPLKDKTT